MRSHIVEVWLGYRSKGSNTVHRIRMESKLAVRTSRKLQAMGRIDFLVIEGNYEPEQKKPFTLNYAERDRITKARRDALGITQKRYRPREYLTRMSFQVGELKNDILVFCPITGICSKLEMPALPITLSYEHPLSKPGNVLRVLKAYSKQNKPKPIERQVWAGMVLCLLNAKNLLRKDEETSSAERNLVLQNAGIASLRQLLYTMYHSWDNPIVWKNMPSFAALWSSHAKNDARHGMTTMTEAIGNYRLLMEETLNPAGISKSDQQRFHEAYKRSEEKKGYVSPKKGLRVYSAQVVQAKNIKESKFEARQIFDDIKEKMPIALRISISRILRNLLLLPDNEKIKAANNIRLHFKTTPASHYFNGKAETLAVLIETASSEKILSDIGSVMQEVAPKPVKSIKEILELKKAKLADKEGENHG